MIQFWPWKISTEFGLNSNKYFNFKQLYVTELMIIETDARKQISKAIEIEKELQSIEIREKMKGHILVNNEDYHTLRK